MKKIIILIVAFLSFAFANPLEFKTLQADFHQNVKSENAKISYDGNFIATNRLAYWHYETPAVKEIYFSQKEVIVIEQELEQAIITKINNTPNIHEILNNAKAAKDGDFIANFDGTDYFIKLENELIKTITYKDKLDNEVEISFKNVKKDIKVNENLLQPKIPNGFDIITQ